MPSSRKCKLEDVEKALKKHKGMKALAADELGVHYHTVNNYCKASPELQKLCDGFREKQLDKTESKLFELIDKGNVAAINFYLATVGKDRGYVHLKKIESNTRVTVESDGVSDLVEWLREASGRKKETDIKVLDSK